MALAEKFGVIDYYTLLDRLPYATVRRWAAYFALQEQDRKAREEEENAARQVEGGLRDMQTDPYFKRLR